MLVINNENRVREGEWMDIDIWGTTIRVKVRPRTEKITEEIRARFKGMKEGKKKNEAILDATYDYLVEDFEGLGSEAEDGTVSHLEPTLENKKKLLFLEVPAGEELILQRVYNKTNEMGFQVVEDNTKNS